MTMTYDDAIAVADAMALVDCHPRSISSEVLCRAFLAQEGHYVAEEIVELQQALGCAPQNGCAVLVLGHDLPTAVLPPGFVTRQSGDYTGFFWADVGLRDRRPIDSSRNAHRTAMDPVIYAPIHAAVERWRDYGHHGWLPDSPTHFWPWGEFTRHHRAQYVDVIDIHGEHFHFSHLYVRGSLLAAVALGAGRLEHVGIVPAGIVPIRWMFDLP